MTRSSPPADRPAEGVLVSIVGDTIDRLRGTIAMLYAAAQADLDRTRGTRTRALRHLTDIEATALAELSTPGSPILGLGFAADPAAFGAPGLAWWRRGQGGRGVQPLGVRTKPGAIDFYDYTETEWWLGSIGDEVDHVFGPYVDHSGTNAYILTFARSVRHERKLAGVVVLDVLVGTLQSLWQATLLRLPKPCSVVNGEGIVIATNDISLMANTVRRSPAVQPAGIHGTDWSVVPGK